MQLRRGATTKAAMQSSDPLGTVQLAVHSHHKELCNGLPCARSKSASADERGRDSGSPFHEDNGAHQSAGSDLICLDHISTTMLLPRRNFSPFRCIRMRQRASSPPREGRVPIKTDTESTRARRGDKRGASCCAAALMSVFDPFRTLGVCRLALARLVGSAGLHRLSRPAPRHITRAPLSGLRG